MSTPKLMQGNEVVAEAAIDAGCTFYAGYPITPSSEIAAVMAKRLPLIGGAFIQMEDEIASMGAIIGASLAGSKSLTATSGPGFSLKQENLGYACMAEVPCVVVNVMRGGPSTGLPTAPSQADIMQARWGTHGDHPIIALSPAYLGEIYRETVRAFNLSEEYRVPVILLLDEITGHMTGKVDVPDKGEIKIINREKPETDKTTYFPYDASRGDVPPMANFFEGHRFHVTGLNHDKTGFPCLDPEYIQKDEERLLRKITKNVSNIEKYECYKTDDATTIIIAHGSMGRSAKAAVDELREGGIKAGLFRPITLWPFPEEKLKDISKGAEIIVVPEMNLGQLILEVERVVKGDAQIYGINQVDSRPIYPSQITERVYSLLKRGGK